MRAELNSTVNRAPTLPCLSCRQFAHPGGQKRERIVTAERVRQRKRLWRGEELDADPYDLPQKIAVKATKLHERLFGFIRFAEIHDTAITAADSSPILGRFEWSEPISAYDGVALRVVPCDKMATKLFVVVELSHSGNGNRNLVVYAGEDGVDAASRWRSWGRILHLPLLVEDREGRLHPAERRLGAIRVNDPQPHAGANPLSARRPLTFGQSGQSRLWGPRLAMGARPLAY
ncbi:hypothetical protein Plav_0638 [Parvibaculum lavamentivorans DS-1]|uniref:Uncharacterized protein n=1 Tax=Parvibaculum lavamentivorans (strain DS-1 / DSM 13023 / NCIMB 13966) TaxID=402881 RepID=A7HQS8_PARL1|nr:hypothetical protein Plav_0638 [Parvibaculum lavamentivorans DS-1]